MSVAEQLKRIRAQRGITQTKLAKMSGVSQAAISWIERGDRSPTEGTLRMIADALGITVADLMSGEQTEQEKPAPERSRQDLMESIGELFKQLPQDQQAEAIGYLRGLAAASAQKR